MKRLFTLFVITALVISGVNAQIGYPYFASGNVLADLSGTATTVTDQSAYAIALSKDFTYQTTGTAGTLISLSNGVYHYDYTPAASGTVRFVKKGTTVYVYEGTVYKGTIGKIDAPTTYPVITDAEVRSNPAQLLQNPSFETLGAPIVTDKYKFGTPWVTNVTEAEFGIRIGKNAGTLDGSYVCVWRGSGNDNYFAQPVSGIKPNTNYQVIVRQVASGNANADFKVGFGSTVNGLELASTKIRLGTTFDGVRTATFTTPETVSGIVYFTFKNTNPNTASSGSDPLTQMDYIALVEGTTSLPVGVTGATGTALYVDGTAYAPVVTLATGDYFDMVSLLANPYFNNGATGWTCTTPAQNKGTATNQNVGAFAGTMPFYENWNGTAYTGKIYQVVSNLPAGKYALQMGVFANNGGDGLFVYADNTETPVSNASTPAFFTLDFITAGGSAEIGLNIKSGTNNWVGIDNISLKYYGPVATPLLSVSTSSMFLPESTPAKSFSVSGNNLTTDINLASDIAGITFSPSSISKNDPALTAGGVNVTATFNPSALGAGTYAGSITVSSTGADSKTIAVTTSKDSGCFTTAYPNNLAPDPTFTDVSKMLGWGSRELLVDISKAYCGASSGHVTGGSYDQRILWKATTSYIVKAYVNANNTNVQLGVYGIGATDVTKQPVNKTVWEQVEFGFTSGASPTTTGGVFLNGADATGAYIDNLEVYEAGLVTFNSNGGSVVASQYVVKNQLATAPSQPTNGTNTFLGWYSDSALTTPWNFSTDVVTSDITLYAKWDTGTDVSLNLNNDEVINTEYYNLQGQKIMHPVINHVYIVKKTFATKKTEVTKAVYVEK